MDIYYSDESIDSGVNFFSGLHSYLSYPALCDIFKEDHSVAFAHSEKARELWNTLLDYDRDQVRFFGSLSKDDQISLIVWYNKLMEEIVTYEPGNEIQKYLYMVSPDQVYTTYQFLAYINDNIDQICTDIWPEYSEHYIERYNSCMSRFAWSFYSGLDPGNKQKLFMYYRNNKH